MESVKASSIILYFRRIKSGHNPVAATAYKFHKDS